MRRPRRHNRHLAIALYLNAGLLAVIGAALLLRGSSTGGVAMAKPQMTPIAGGGALYLMPAQFSLNTWGCYLMDIDAQTICAYEYLPRGEGLKLVAARNFRHDRNLGRFNTSPNPEEIQRLIEIERNPLRGRDNFAPPPLQPENPTTDPVEPPASEPKPDLIVPDPGLIVPDPKLIAPGSDVPPKPADVPSSEDKSGAAR